MPIDDRVQATLDAWLERLKTKVAFHQPTTRPGFNKVCLDLATEICAEGHAEDMRPTIYQILKDMLPENAEGLREHRR